MFVIYRDYIKHEDTLTQYRVSWLLSLTAMLLTTYVTLFGVMFVSLSATLTTDPANWVAKALQSQRGLLFVPIVLLSFAGLVTAIVCFASLLGGSRSAISVIEKWDALRRVHPDPAKDEWLPEVTFGFSHRIKPTAGYPKTICVAVGLLWLTSMFADWLLFVYFHSLPAAVP